MPETGPYLTVTVEPDTQPTVIPALVALANVLDEATAGRCALEIETKTYRTAPTSHHVSTTVALRLDVASPLTGRLFAALSALFDGEVGAGTDFCIGPRM